MPRDKVKSQKSKVSAIGRSSSGRKNTDKQTIVTSVDEKAVKSHSDKKTSAKLAATMEDLMTRDNGEFSVPKRGSRITGTVTDITSRMLLLDIAAKTEGMVINKEYDEARDYIRSLAVGDKIEVYVLTPENDRGQILLAVREAASKWQWQKLAEWMARGEVVEVRGLDVNKGGLVARVEKMSGITGFIPSSQLGGSLSGNLDDLVNKLMRVKVIEVDQTNNRLIFSERHVSEAGQIEARREALTHLAAGMVLPGVVTGLTDFGAFVKVAVGDGEVEGLLHISEMSWEKINDPSTVVKEGDEVKVKVIDVRPDTGKVGFSLKQLGDDPWQGIETRYPPGKKVAGTVQKVASFGAIVQLEPGVTGLLHISKIPTSNEPTAGDKIEVVVEDLDADHRRLALGMAAMEVPLIYR